MKASVYDVVLTERQVEIPDACPKCGADLRDAEEANLMIYQLGFHHERAFIVSDPEEPELIVDYANWADDCGPEVVGKTSYQCRACDHILARGEITERNI